MGLCAHLWYVKCTITVDYHSSEVSECKGSNLYPFIDQFTVALMCDRPKDFTVVLSVKSAQ